MGYGHGDMGWCVEWWEGIRGLGWEMQGQDVVDGQTECSYGV